MIRKLAALLLCVALPAAAQDGTPPDRQQGDNPVASGQGAILRGLDKVNGQTVDIELLSGGGRAVFGLEIELADCRYPINNPTGDAFAFLTIREQLENSIIFQGWMMAAAPALNALDHSRYDVWVIRCITA